MRPQGPEAMFGQMGSGRGFPQGIFPEGMHPWNMEDPAFLAANKDRFAHMGGGRRGRRTGRDNSRVPRGPPPDGKASAWNMHD